MNPVQLSPEPSSSIGVKRKRRRARAAESRQAMPVRRVVLINRAFDVCLSVVLVCVFSVPMLFIAALVRMTSRGPALYKQERTGLDGKPFVIYKFRTMRDGAEAETGPVWSRRGDPRCTRLGGVLRRYSLDELPQLYNVLKGEMSLVGPRPERPYFVSRFARRFPGYHRRHEVLPGITGWAQVNGWRGDTSIEKRLEYDLFYVNNFSVWFNLRIVLLTPLRVLMERSTR